MPDSAARARIHLRLDYAAQVVPFPAAQIGPTCIEDLQRSLGAAGQVLALGAGDGLEIQALFGLFEVYFGLLALGLGVGTGERGRGGTPGRLAPFPGYETDGNTDDGG